LAGVGQQWLRVAAGLLVVLLMGLTVASPLASAFITDSGFTVQVNATLVAPMKKLVLVGPDDVTAFRLVPGQKQVLLGGTGHFTLVDISQNPYVVWAWSIIGRATIVDYDNSRTPNWYVVGTNAGEVLAVNAKNPEFRVSYFTAGRAPILDIGVGTNDVGQNNLFILDNQQYLYIYSLPEPAWLEIGPNPRDGPLSSLAGFPVRKATFTGVIDTSGNVTYDSTRLAVLLDQAPGAVVEAMAYVAWPNGTSTPAYPSTWMVEDERFNRNVTMTGTLYYSLVVMPYNTLLELTQAPNYTIVIEDVPPTQLRLFTAYTVEIRDAETGELLATECYSTLSGLFEPKPYETYKLIRQVLEKRGASIEECIASFQLDPNDQVPNLAFHPIMVVRTSGLPKETINFRTGGDAWVILLPYPADSAPPNQALIWEAYSFKRPVQGWPAGATSLLLAAADRYLYIYVTDSLFFPKRFSTTYGYLEVVDLGSQILSVTTDWTGESIFVGTSSGMVAWLKWDANARKYVATATIQVSGSQVTSVSYLAGGYLLVTTADGRLQLVNLDGWYPVWRGPYGYEGIETGARGLVAEAYSLDMIVAATPTQRTSSFYVMKIDNPDLVRATVRVELAKVGLTGAVAVDTLPPESVLMVYTAGGDLVASVNPEGNQFIVYLPPGTYKLAFKIPGLGVFEKEATIEFPEYRDTVRLSYREVRVVVTVPPPAEGQRYPPDVTIGPLPGAMVQAVPVEVDAGLGISLSPTPVYAVTNSNGEALLTLWDGVVYNITVYKPGYKNASATVPPYGPATVSLQVVPEKVEQEGPIIRYYDIVISVIDDRGEPVSLAVVEIYDPQGQLVQAGTTAGDGTLRVRLPEGNYTVKVRADGYLEKTAVLNVPTVTQLTVTLEPTGTTKAMRYLPYFAVIALLIVLVAAVWMLRERIARRLSEEEEYF